jgi:flagellar hook-length control protein FliK
MSAAPDLLLKAAPEVKPKAPPAKAPAKTAEPSKDGASDFAKVYAKERQAKSAERSDASARTTDDKSSEAKPEGAEEESTAAAMPVVADSGNDLPADPAELDPLLLFGMGQQVPAEEPGLGAELSGEEELPPVTMPSTPVAKQAEVIPDFEPDKQAEPLLRIAPEPEAKAQVVQQAVTGAQSAANAGQNMAGALAAFADPREAVGKTEAEAEPVLGEFRLEALEGLKEASSTSARSEDFASKLNALSQAIAQQSTQVTRPVVVPGQPLPMQQGVWSEAVVDRVMWMSSQNLKSAEIQLDPAELGRLEVRIQVSQEQTQVTFASPHANVRDALEGQLHRLRELFTQQGMNLLDVNVSDQSLARGQQEQSGDGRQRGGAASRLLGEAEGDLSLGSSERHGTVVSSGRGLVDYYA